MIWHLVWSARALKDIDRLTPKNQDLVMAALGRFAETGYGDLQRLHGVEREYRLRTGDYRVRLTLDFSGRNADVLRVAHRREAYR